MTCLLGLLVGFLLHATSAGQIRGDERLDALVSQPFAALQAPRQPAVQSPPAQPKAAEETVEHGRFTASFDLEAGTRHFAGHALLETNTTAGQTMYRVWLCHEEGVAYFALSDPYKRPEGEHGFYGTDERVRLVLRLPAPIGNRTRAELGSSVILTRVSDQQIAGRLTAAYRDGSVFQAQFRARSMDLDGHRRTCLYRGRPLL